MLGQSIVVTPIARLRSIAERALKRVRKREAVKDEEPQGAEKDDLVVEAFVQQQGMYDSVWGGRATTGVYVVGRNDDGTFRFVSFM